MDGAGGVGDVPGIYISRKKIDLKRLEKMFDFLSSFGNLCRDNCKAQNFVTFEGLSTSRGKYEMLYH